MTVPASAVEPAALIRAGELSAREAVEGALRAIEREDGEIGAFVTLCGERAGRGRGRPAGAIRGRYAGCAFGVKDLFTGTERAADALSDLGLDVSVATPDWDDDRFPHVRMTAATRCNCGCGGSCRPALGSRAMPSWRRRAAALLLVVLVLPLPAFAQDESTLRGRIERTRARERALSGAVVQLSGLLARTQRDIAIVQARLTAVEADLATAVARLAATQERLRIERLRLVRLRRRLAENRIELAAQLVADYKRDEPDIVSLVVGADDFSDLIEQVKFIKRLQERNGEIVARVHAARDETDRSAERLARVEKERQATADAVRSRRDALVSMRAGLTQREATLARVRAARAEALAGTRAGRVAAERALGKLIAEREAAARALSGPWGIPSPVVQCESGGQNLPPNRAGASGYYQMLPSTWRGLGGSTPQAYQAPKPEQDRLAARLWAGGGGARNWVCSRLVD